MISTFTVALLFLCSAPVSAKDTDPFDSTSCLKGQQCDSDIVGLLQMRPETMALEDKDEPESIPIDEPESIPIQPSSLVQVDHLSKTVGASASYKNCPCTFNPKYPCFLWGHCYSLATKSKCDKYKGKFCLEGPPPAPTPAPTSAPPSPGPPSPGSSEKATSANCGSEGFTQAEAQEMLDWHNKFRCAAGNPPIEWNGALQCQAQETQNKIGAFSHSNSYSLDISSGENLATGTSVSMAAWMWFTEYTQADCSAGQNDKCGHYTAMVWKSSTHLGCGIQRDGGGVIRCQYAASPPNYANQYSSNVPKFEGEESKFQKCGLTIEETKQKVEQFKGWGILHPIAPYDSSLGI